MSLPLQKKGHKKDNGYYPFCVPSLLRTHCPLRGKKHNEGLSKRLRRDKGMYPFCAPIIFFVSLPLQGKGHKRDSSYLCPFFCCEEIKAALIFYLLSFQGILALSFAREKIQRRTKQAFLIPSREGTQPALQKKGHKWLVSLEGIKAALIIPSFQGILALSLAREGTQQRTKQGIRDTNLALHYLLISRSLVCKIKDKG